MSSAELQFDPFDHASDKPAHDGNYSPSERGSTTLLQQQVSDRLATHRAKRTRKSSSNVIAIPQALSGTESGPLPAVNQPSSVTLPASRSASSRPSSPRSASNPMAAAETGTTRPARAHSSRIAAAVAERYAQSPTYRDFLAAEAARAVEEASANAEMAARRAEAVIAVQQQLLAELDLWDAVGAAPAPSPALQSPVPHVSQPDCNARDAVGTASLPALAPPIVGGLTIRLYEDTGLRQAAAERASQPRLDTLSNSAEEEQTALNDLDAEIAFRHAPISDEPIVPTVAIPANLLEFPRQLVAARKARPRLAEGPLREEADASPAAAQLRIFEVDAAQFSTAPPVEGETALPEWSSIFLDATPAHLPGAVPTDEFEPQSSAAQLQAPLYAPLQTARLNDRLLAAAVDACLLGTALLASITTFALAVNQLPGLPVAAIASFATLFVLAIVYHLLFFTFSDATPGMRYARIGLCTFDDENPTRAQMRRRTWAILLAVAPLGLGLLWTFLDGEGLGLHDRLSRMYQRSY